MRPHFRPQAAAAAGVLAAISVSLPLLAQTSAPAFTNVTVHDPSVVREDDTFYVFGSHLASARSPDLIRWTQLSTLPTAGNPLAPNPPQEFQEALQWVGEGNAFWAPDVIKLPDGRFAYYYCIGRLDQPRAALGLAFSSSITGPYRHETILLRSGPGGQPPEAGATYDATVHPNTVDPALYYDEADQLWMVYGSYSGGIFILKMDAATGRPLPGQGYGKKLIGGNHARIEGAYILHSPETKYYYLFVSFGGLREGEGYHLRLGRSREPDGPYVDAAGTDLVTVAGAPGSLFDDASIAPHGVKLMGGYQFLALPGEPRTQSRGYLSPGHNSAYRDPVTGKYFNLFHTRFVGRGSEHEVRVHQMFLNEDGWLVVAPHRYAGETIGSTSAALIAGDYKLINHGKSFNTTVNTSVVITLRADGSISGAVTGSWQQSGDYLATLVLGNTSYRGVFIRQWDDDQQLWVQAFTALSDDGVAVWGSKVASLVAEDPPPTITLQPWSLESRAGSTVTFNVGAQDAAAYQWSKDAVPLANGDGPLLVLDNVSASDAGNYRVAVSNAQGSVTSNPATLTVRAAGADSRIKNLSVRTNLAAGQLLIAGFNTSGPNDMLIRAVGPALDEFLDGAHPDPQIGLYVGQSRVEENDNWPADVAPVFARNGAFALPAGSRDAAVVRATNGGLTAHISGPGSGIVLLEVYDDGGSGRLINVSARNRVGVGADALIAGFVVTGSVARSLLIRGIGPKLADFEVPGHLVDPKLEIYRSVPNRDSVRMAENDDWDSAWPELITRAGAAGLPLSPGSKDAAVFVTVPPGLYSAVVSGVDNTTGEALVEVYELP